MGELARTPCHPPRSGCSVMTLHAPCPERGRIPLNPPFSNFPLDRSLEVLGGLGIRANMWLSLMRPFGIISSHVSSSPGRTGQVDVTVFLCVKEERDE